MALDFFAGCVGGKKKHIFVSKNVWILQPEKCSFCVEVSSINEFVHIEWILLHLIRVQVQTCLRATHHGKRCKLAHAMRTVTVRQPLTPALVLIFWTVVWKGQHRLVTPAVSLLEFAKERDRNAGPRWKCKGKYIYVCLHTCRSKLWKKEHNIWISLDSSCKKMLCGRN